MGGRSPQRILDATWTSMRWRADILRVSPMPTSLPETSWCESDFHSVFNACRCRFQGFGSPSFDATSARCSAWIFRKQSSKHFDLMFKRQGGSWAIDHQVTSSSLTAQQGDARPSKGNGWEPCVSSVEAYRSKWSQAPVLEGRVRHTQEIETEAELQKALDGQEVAWRTCDQGRRSTTRLTVVGVPSDVPSAADTVQEPIRREKTATQGPGGEDVKQCVRGHGQPSGASQRQLFELILAFLQGKFTLGQGKVRGSKRKWTFHQGKPRRGLTDN